MSYAAQKPVFIARKHGTSGLAGFAEALQAAFTGAATVTGAAYGSGTTTQQTGPVAQESGPPWGLILGGAAVVGLGVVLLRSRKK